MHVNVTLAYAFSAGFHASCLTLISCLCGQIEGPAARRGRETDVIALRGCDSGRPGEVPASVRLTGEQLVF